MPRNVSVDHPRTDYRTFATHCDGIRDANGVVLPTKHSFVGDGLLDFLAQVEEVHVARIALPPS